MKIANQILGELTELRNDTWYRIFVDAAVCATLFALATSIAGVIMYFVDPLVNTRLAIVYLPVWSSSMLSVAYYARWRKRLRFTNADLAWAVPVLLALSMAIDLLGPSSFWVFIIAYVTYFGTWHLRSYVETQLRSRNERRHRPKSPTML